MDAGYLYPLFNDGFGGKASEAIDLTTPSITPKSEAG